MVAEDPQAMIEESALIAQAPVSVRLTQRQRTVLKFLAIVVPLWGILAALMITDQIMMLVFLGVLALIVVLYGMRTEYLIFLWLAMEEYSLLATTLGLRVSGIGLKGVFFAAVLVQLPNKFALMPRKILRTVPMRWALYPFLIWAGASLFWSPYWGVGLRLYIRWVMAFFLFALIFLSINERNKRWFITAFVIIVGTSVIYGVLQRFGVGLMTLQEEEQFFVAHEWESGGSMIFRATGLYGHPNGFGQECVLELLALLLILVAWRPRPVVRIAVLIMAGLTLTTIVLSFSRVAWSILSAGVLVFLSFTRPRWLIVFAAIAIGVAIIAWPDVRTRVVPVLTGTDGSLAARKRATEIYLDSWEHSPIVGYGIGSTGGGALFEARIVPHEGYVCLLIYLGAIGLLLYVRFLVTVLRNAWRIVHNAYIRTDPELRAMAALGMAVATMLVVNFWSDVMLETRVFYLLGCGFGALRLARARQAREAAAAAEAAASGSTAG